MKHRRKFLEKSCTSAWATPLMVLVSLPAHASTSHESWEFHISYTKNCISCGLGQPAEEEIEVNPPYKEMINFTVSDDEITERVFYRSYDQDGNGIGADYFSYRFFIDNSSTLKISGKVERRSVDVPDILSGYFLASKS